MSLTSPSKCLVIVAIFLAATIFPCSTKVVVFFSVPAVSHIRYHTDMARAVAKLGHEAWVCIPNFLKGSERIDLTGINALHYGETLGNLEEKLLNERLIQVNFWDGKTFSPIDHLQLLLFTMRTLDATLKEGLIYPVKRVDPDLFVVDAVPFLRMMLVIPYKLGIPFAFAGSHHDVINARVPFSPAATPNSMLPYSDQMTFIQRLHTTATYFVETSVFRLFEPNTVTKYAPEMPHTTPCELATRAAIYLAETDPILDYPRPTLPNTKLIGGTTVKAAKPLKDPFKSFVEKSKFDIVIVTFGSAILDLPENIYQKMSAAFGQLDISVVWRVNVTSTDSKNVLTDTWIPQNDLLGHPKTKLFVSHCGKSGQYEALYNAVPLLCLPVFADQSYNAERVKVKGFGLRADIRKITVAELTELLRELLTDRTYRINIAKASNLFRLLYKSPMEEAAYWLDHVMVYGGDYMRASSQTMPVYQFLMLDVFACFSFLTAIFMFLLDMCIRCCCCRKRHLKRKAD